MPLRQRLEHRDTFRADRQAVGCVLDVAATDDRAVRRLESGADLEPGVARVGMATRAARGGDEQSSIRVWQEFPPAARGTTRARGASSPGPLRGSTAPAAR